MDGADVGGGVRLFKWLGWGSYESQGAKGSVVWIGQAVDDGVKPISTLDVVVDTYVCLLV